MPSTPQKPSFWLNLALKFLTYPKILLLIILILTLFFGYITLTRLKIDNDVTKMMPQTNPVRAYYEKTQDIFGSGSPIVIAIEDSSGIFNLKILEKIKEFTDAAELIDNQINLNQFQALVKHLQPGETQALFYIFNEKASESNSFSEFLNALQEDEISRENKYQSIFADKSKLQAIYALLTQTTDDLNHWQKRVRDVKSLTKIDYVFASFTNTLPLESFAVRMKLSPLPFVALSSYFAEKGFSRQALHELFINGRLKQIMPFFDFSQEETGLLASLPQPAQAAWFNLIKDLPKKIMVSKLLQWDKLKQNPKLEFFLLQERLASWDLYKDFLFSSKRKDLTLIHLEMVPHISFQHRDILIQQVENLAQNVFGNSGIRYYIAGEPVLTKAFGVDMTKDLNYLSPIVIVLIGFFLYISFRHWRGVFYPLLTVVISVIWTMGTIFLLGFSITILMSSLPVILMAVGSAYGIHVIHHYYGDCAPKYGKNQGISITLKEIGIAVVMAGLTTIAGFISMAPTDILPLRDFGIFAAVGTLYALCLALIMIPAFLMVDRLPLRIIAKTKIDAFNERKPDHLAFILEKIGKYSIHHKKTLLGIFLVLIGLSLIGILQLKVEMNNIEYFKSDTPIRQADRVINDAFAGTSNLTVVINTRQKDGILNQTLLKKAETFIQTIETEFKNNNSDIPLVGKVSSILDLIKKMHQTMNYGDPNFYKIPDEIMDAQGKMVYFSHSAEKQKHLAAIYASYLDQFGPNNTRSLIDSEKSQLNISFLLKTGSSSQTEILSKRIQELAKTTFSTGQEVNFTGMNIVENEFNHLLVQGQITGVISSILLVLLLVWSMQKSVILGLISIIPLCAAVLINFGLMGFAGIHLEASTAIIANISVGIGVDYVIHYLNGYILYRKKGFNKEEATIQTTGLIGEAVLINALSVAIGFLVLLLSSFTPLVNSAWLLAAAMFTTALGSLTLIPVILNYYTGRIPLLNQRNV